MRFRSLNAEPSSDKAATSLKELSISCGLETKGVAAFPAEETQLRVGGFFTVIMLRPPYHRNCHLRHVHKAVPPVPEFSKKDGFFPS